ncbi:insulin-degrading enzyme-like isoform X2 [Hibiscus syriacus]|uniref:Insulin-degrading enzyme-like isoform X2 n=1 Tax=Hibiscus syriacus TaxID=106335 RepID=A0A6A3CCE6_HIBSY|nr:insulin-degrading enzyme-like isoform X2 [Hibiscus syriacus]
MKLVVIGEPLDVLQQWVVELFSGVKQGSQGKPEFKVEGPIWSAGKLYRLEAVKDVHILELSWALPCLLQEYPKKPKDYLAHLLGQIFHIIGYVYQYLKLLRQLSPQEWIFKELQDMGNMDFRFAEEESQDDYAAELAENLLVYPPEHVIYGDYVYELWEEETIRKILSFFTPRNMRIDVVTKSFKLHDVQYEPWFGSPYSEEEISSSLMELWEDPQEIDASLHLPVKNEFIPCDFSIRADSTEINPANETLPICIFDEPLMKFWYKLDSTFKLPRANTYFRINLKGAYLSLRSCLLTELYIHLLKDDLNEIIYQASIAKLETSVAMYSDKLELKLYGFNDKLPVLLGKILTIANSFLPTNDRFKVHASPQTVMCLMYI